jgi:hypothetical protein
MSIIAGGKYRLTNMGAMDGAIVHVRRSTDAAAEVSLVSEPTPATAPVSIRPFLVKPENLEPVE